MDLKLLLFVVLVIENVVVKFFDDVCVGDEGFGVFVIGVNLWV